MYTNNLAFTVGSMEIHDIYGLIAFLGILFAICFVVWVLNR